MALILPRWVWTPIQGRSGSVGAFSPGRVLNAKTARSQLIGGMTFGVGMALLEEAVVDLRSGAFVSCDLAGYLVPVHADIPVIDAVILDVFDDKANVLGVKGLGELGICGAGAAVAILDGLRGENRGQALRRAS
jgi:xanthine dehydrogenase YagR molybdenum-binding subunit